MVVRVKKAIINHHKYDDITNSNVRNTQGS